MSGAQAATQDVKGGPVPSDIEAKKEEAAIWFRSLRDRICAAFEAIEDDAGERAAAVSCRCLRPRVREGRRPHLHRLRRVLAGVPQADPGAEEDPRFWASGISLIAHPHNPERAGRAHEHPHGGDDELVVRRRRRPHPGARPAPHPGRPGHGLLPQVVRTGLLQAPCGRRLSEIQGSGATTISSCRTATSRAASAASSTTGCIRPTGGWDADFAFTQDVGRTFLIVYPHLVRKNFNTPWTDEDREEQLVRRGRYVEFNLLYDRGTIFGLKTGGNVASILSSMPPAVKWP
jgi:coproporphyrinogen III oxidase